MKLGKAYIDIDQPVEAGSWQNIVYTFETESNPIAVVDATPRLSHWWADFHGQSE